MQKVRVILEDDLDGTEAAETITFGIEGKRYEIDLSVKNAEKFRKAISKYATAARPVRAARRETARARLHERRERLAEVRTWAREQGYEVADRGRVPTVILEAYDAAHTQQV